MKKYLLGLMAVVIAIGSVAFTIQKPVVKNAAGKYTATPRYYEYITSTGDQTVFSNYNDLGTSTPVDCGDVVRLCWLKVVDADQDDDIDAIDFAAAFNAIDGDFGGSANNSLDDETVDLSYFSKKE